MIIKSFEFHKVINQNKKNYLFYGENAGLKNEIIRENFKSKFENKTFNYDENEILKNKDKFFEEILSSSFFENEKLIIVSRSTDKIIDIAEEIIERNLDNLIIIFVSEKLEKKSKIRNLFEKNKDSICVPFYQDNYQSLALLTKKFFNRIKMPISQEILNTIVEKSNGNRESLYNELEKIENYSKNKQKLNLNDIIKLINLSENNSISELVDFCLAKNERKILSILNDNNFSNEDAIIIIRTFLNKTKRLIKLQNEIKNNKNADVVISTFKPPIFWKDKELVKDQLKNWSEKNIKNLLYSINEIELLIKKNYQHSIKMILNFIFSTSKINQ
jgi:DNA polymerase III subunit delta